MSSSVFIAFCTCPDSASAEHLATTLDLEGLAACVNQLHGVQSTYLWKGELQRDSEVLLIKTTTDQLATLAARLKALHPYELPELIAVPVCAGSEHYLDWIRQNTASKQ